MLLINYLTIKINIQLIKNNLKLIIYSLLRITISVLQAYSFSFHLFFHDQIHHYCRHPTVVKLPNCVVFSMADTIIDILGPWTSRFFAES